MPSNNSINSINNFINNFITPHGKSSALLSCLSKIWMLLYAVMTVQHAHAEPRMPMVASPNIPSTSKPFLSPQELSGTRTLAPVPRPQPVYRPLAAAPMQTPPPPPNNFGKQVGFTPSLPRVGDEPSAKFVRKKINSTVNSMQNMQLNESDVQTIKNINLRNLHANASPYLTAPKPIIRTLMLDLSPGVSPPAIKLSSGNLTSLVFSDIQGDAWMIDRVSMNRQLFNDAGGAAAGESATNVLTIEPTQAISQGNIIVMLKGLATPIIFTLTSGGNSSVDFRVDVKVSGYNPDSTLRGTHQNNTMPELDNSIAYFLDGVPPREAKKINTSNSQVQAWDLDGKLYVRTMGAIQYPAYQSSARSTSGMAVYRFNQMYRMFTVLQNGGVLNVSLEF